MRKPLLACALLIAVHAQAAVPAAQRDALVALYQSTNGPNWVGKLNWLGAPGTECTWYGVSCDDGEQNIAGIELTFNDLTGTLPAAIGSLKGLRTLNLSDNHLSGAIPPEIGQLSELQSLYLGGNELTGHLPDAIGNLKKVEYVAINENKLDGSLPSTIGGMSALINIDLGGNAFTGSIPSSVGNLANATRMPLAGNQLTGPGPQHFARVHQPLARLSERPGPRKHRRTHESRRRALRRQQLHGPAAARDRQLEEGVVRRLLRQPDRRLDPDGARVDAGDVRALF